MASFPAGSIGGPGVPGNIRIVEASVNSEVLFERNAMGRFLSQIERAGDGLLDELGQRMADRARANAPKRTGRLARSIKYFKFEIGGARGVVIGSNVSYAGVMESGSRPHLIHGVRGSFDWEGGRFIAADFRYGPGDGPGAERKGYVNWTKAHGATVRHPGTRPYNYLGRAYDSVWPDARRIMRKVYPGN